ncbi:MAG: hypothetical protein ABR498_06335 [Candidatus Dormibacteria bacterium]
MKHTALTLSGVATTFLCGVASMTLATSAAAAGKPNGGTPPGHASSHSTGQSASQGNGPGDESHSSGGGPAGASSNAAPASQADENAGDVWLDSVGAPAGPGHEMDPHLPCADVNLWGAGLADPSGSFTIDGWAPSGSGQADSAGNWSYDAQQGGSQVIAVIGVNQLLASAAANGETAAHQGFHFKLQLAQDPQKHKVFWIDCTPSSGVSAAGGEVSGASTVLTAASQLPAASSVLLSERVTQELAASTAATPATSSATSPPATTSPSEVDSGVLGISVGAPSTGAAMPFPSALAALLIVGGVRVIAQGRRKRRP